MSMYRLVDYDLTRSQAGAEQEISIACMMRFCRIRSARFVARSRATSGILEHSGSRA